MVNLRDPGEKAAERLMGMEFGARQAQRNGYRGRDWETRAGTVKKPS